MNRKKKIELVLFLSAIYFILFVSNNQIKMNMNIMANNEKKIDELQVNKKIIEKKIEVTKEEYKLYSNDVAKYISLINKNILLDTQINSIKNEISSYQSKTENLNNILKDN